ncbi:hypothetical protein L6452_39783 [Arctium lappa]|uniref:Uncharacterized protein n=1 Tax=Arctium lappa TaxID=4217 RepID=A0ACB8XTT8_ARCLA|nr:hypothetical protein L6452_39783 [Arctium lappa]
MVRNALLTKDCYQLFAELPARERQALASGPNRDYNDRRGYRTTSLGTFHQHSRGLPTGLVREFYASMVPEVFHDCGRVWVWGVPVEITSNAINEHLFTPTIPHEQYHNGFPDSARFYPELGQIAAALRRDGSNIWIPGTTELQHGELHPDMAFWSVFIKHSLLPFSHRTVVSIETARLLYVIQTGVPFDVGHFILGSILKTGTESRCLLNFPCLITYFCGRAGIPEAFDDAILVAPPLDICKKAYNLFCTRHALPNVSSTGRYRNRGRHGDAAPQHEGPVQGARPPPPPPMGGHQDIPPPWERLTQAVDELRSGQQAHGEILRKVRVGQRRTNQRLDQVYQLVDRRFTNVNYTRGPRNVIYDPSASQSQEGEDWPVCFPFHFGHLVLSVHVCLLLYALHCFRAVWVTGDCARDCAPGTIAKGTIAKEVPRAGEGRRLCHAIVPWHYRRRHYRPGCTVSGGSLAIVTCDSALGTIAGHYRPRGQTADL